MRARLFVNTLLLVCGVIGLHVQAAASLPEKLYFQFSWGVSMQDDHDHLFELLLNGPPLNSTPGFFNEDYTFEYGSAGVVATANQDLFPPAYALGALILTSPTYVNGAGVETYCSSYAHFHDQACPNAVGWFTDFSLPLAAGQSIVLLPAGSVPEPGVVVLMMAGLVALMYFVRR